MCRPDRSGCQNGVVKQQTTSIPVYRIDLNIIF